ncbi:hypothetical protein LCGC14_3060970, partial [marine sediment metagenome]
VLYSAALLLLGGQFMSIGFVAELFIAYHDPDVKAYSIAERTDQAEGKTKPPHYTKKTEDQ